VVDAPLPAPAGGVEPPAPRPVLGHVLVIAAVSLLAVNAVVVKVTIDSGGLAPTRLAEVRSLGSAAVLLAALAILRPRTLRLPRREWLPVAVFGVLGIAAGQYLFLASVERLDVGVALVIIYLAPVLVAAWSRLVGREPVRRRLWFALAVSLGGLSLVVDLWSGLALDGAGVAAALGCAVAYAVYILGADLGIKRGHAPTAFLTWGFLFAALFWSAVQPWWDFPAGVIGDDASLLGRLDGVSLPVWWLLAYAIVPGSVLPFILFVTALRHLSATRVAIVATFEPVVATIAAFAWLGESLSAQEIAGGILVLAAVALAQTAHTGS